MKRMIALLLTVLLLLALAACGGTPSAPASEPPESASIAPATPFPVPTATPAPTPSPSPAPTEEPVQEDPGKELLEQGQAFWFGTQGETFDMEQARAAFQQAADAGSAQALYWLGDVRRYDQDGDRWSEVKSFYQKAVDAGAPYGLYGLGTLYEWGCGVEKDIDQAVALYEQATKEGCLMGDVALGQLYSHAEHGDTEVELDIPRAEALYTGALESEDLETRALAAVRLGDLYRYAMGRERDDVQAMEWYRKAAAEGYYKASLRIMDSYRDGIGVEADTAEMLAWAQKQADQGFAYSLGQLYLSGDGGAETDYARALEIYGETLEHGDRSAALTMCGMVTMTANGLGTKRDKEAAIQWCYKAREAAGPFDDSDDPEERLHKPLPYVRYVLAHYGVEG